MGGETFRMFSALHPARAAPAAALGPAPSAQSVVSRDGQLVGLPAPVYDAVL